MRKSIVVLAFLLSGLSGFALSLYLHQGSAEAPVARTFHYPIHLMEQLKSDPQAGEKIFKAFCATCHAPHPRIAIQAPRIGDTTIWKPLQQAGIQNLLNSTIKGKGAMPARGGCFECSDEQLKKTIQYMLEQSKERR